MQKKFIISVITIIAIFGVVAGSLYYFGKDDVKNPGEVVTTSSEETKADLEPNGLIGTESDESQYTVINKKALGKGTVKFISNDMRDGCLYRVNGNEFYLTEDNDGEEAVCYLKCKTESLCTPEAITGDGKYLIVQDTNGEKWAIPLIESGKQQQGYPKKALNEITEKEKSLLFKFEEVTVLQ